MLQKQVITQSIADTYDTVVFYTESDLIVALNVGSTICWQIKLVKMQLSVIKFIQNCLYDFYKLCGQP